MIVRTVVAYCDFKEGLGCDAFENIDPSHTQPHRLLTDLGWMMVNAEDEIETYCPKHHPKETDV